MEKTSTSPWKELYDKLGEECSENETEREILKMLGEGKSIPDCAKYGKSRGMTDNEFLEFMKRTDSRETEVIYNETQKTESGVQYKHQ